MRVRMASKRANVLTARRIAMLRRKKKKKKAARKKVRLRKEAKLWIEEKSSTSGYVRKRCQS